MGGAHQTVNRHSRIIELHPMRDAHPVTGYTGTVRGRLNDFWQP